MSDLDVTYEDGIATVTINRPEQRNSVTYAMWNGFAEVFGGLSAEKDVRAVILTGAGEDFSAGADISEFGQIRGNLEKAKEYEVAVDLGCAAITRCAKPVIAVNRGYTLGGGAHLAMSADFRFAHTDAVFGIPAANLSIVYGVQGTRKLLALVGLPEAKRILYSAQRFDAVQALKSGFADKISADPMAAALNFARSLRAKAPLTQAGAKYILNGAALDCFDAAEADRLIDGAAASFDYAEGRAAFAEKRPPAFRGE